MAPPTDPSHVYAQSYQSDLRTRSHTDNTTPGAPPDTYSRCQSLAQIGRLPEHLTPRYPHTHTHTTVARALLQQDGFEGADTPLSLPLSLSQPTPLVPRRFCGADTVRVARRLLSRANAKSIRARGGVPAARVPHTLRGIRRRCRGGIGRRRPCLGLVGSELAVGCNRNRMGTGRRRLVGRCHPGVIRA